MNIMLGPYELTGPVALAPMAGITDAPFRLLCRRFGASIAATEMVIADTQLWTSRKSRPRLYLADDPEPRVVQIAGSEPRQMAAAARAAIDQGAQVIDINMGCPAKKVCRKLAGSALLKNEQQVENILHAVVSAVDAPVTLKMRTGWDPGNRNGVRIAKLAESIGIRGLAVHGRTRACKFRGPVEYETIRNIKSEVGIPVFANGDIVTPAQARSVLDFTRADGVMLGRVAQGQPWIFQEVAGFLQKKCVQPLSIRARRDIILAHLESMYELYGEYRGIRVARKHLGWYCQHLAGAKEFLSLALRVECSSEQIKITKKFFDRLCIDTEATEKHLTPGEPGTWCEQQEKRQPQNRQNLQNRHRLFRSETGRSET